MKKALSLFFMLVVCYCVLVALTQRADAAEYTSGSYTYTVSGNQATITKASSELSGVVSIPSSLDGYPVVAIGNAAFKNCSEITLVTFNSSLVSIGSEAFENCSKLQRITIPNSVTAMGQFAFYNCDSLTSVTIGTGLSTVPISAFANCECLESISLGAVTKIQTGAFYNCIALCEIDLGTALKTIEFSDSYNGRDYGGEGAFENCTAIKTLTIPDTTTDIAYRSFKGCNNATQIILGDSVTTIGAEAFENCLKLQQITIPDSVTTMGQFAFYNCDSLTSVTIGTGLSTLPISAFANCECLESVSLGAVTYIKTGAFYNCVALSEIDWGTALKTIEYSDSYNGRNYGGIGAFENCISLKSLTIPDTVTAVGPSAFYNCDGLRTVTIGSKVTTIGDRAFKECSNVTQVTLGSKVTTIGKEAFEKCAKLQQIAIPDSVTTMGQFAFYNCDSLTSVTIGTDLSTVSTSAFANCDCLESISLGAVTKIQTGAFYNCIALCEIDLGTALKTIEYSDSYNGRDYGGKGAFENCTAIKTLTIPDTTTDIAYRSFKGCSNLTRITLGKRLTTIGAEAFENCLRLQQITIPDSVTTMGQFAFYNCDSLTSVTIGTGLSTLPISAFANCECLESVSLGAVTYIKTGAFYNCVALSEIDWGTALKTIEFSDSYNGRDYGGKGAFENCISLKSLTIPNTVTAVGPSAFYNCDGLRTVTIGSKVTTIGDRAFKECNNVTQVTLGSNVTTIGSEAFENCSKLQRITIPDSVTTLGQFAFYNCDSLTSVTIGTGLSTVSTFAFAECAILESVSLGAVAYIKTGAFYNCTALSEVDWGTALKTMEFSDSYNGRNYGNRGAFENCTSLASLRLPNTVTAIGRGTFYKCYNVLDVYFGIKLQSIGKQAFYSTGITDVYYSGSQEDWGYVTVDTGNEAVTNAQFHYNYVEDTVLPGVAVTSTNNLATTQTVTLKLTDNTGIVRYYWGTNSSPSSSAYTSITSVTSKTVTKTVSESGTYYLIAIDAAGNSQKTSVTFYKITFNSNGGSVSPSYVIAQSGNNVGMPTPVRGDYLFVGWGTTSASTGAVTSITATSNKTYYAIWKDASDKFDIPVARMVLGNALEFQFGVDMSKIPNKDGYYAVIEKNWTDGSVTTKTIPASQWGTVGQYWAIVYDGVAAKEMADVFNVTIYNAKGQAISNAKTDSVRDYVMRNVDKQSDVLKTLMVNMLNYGAAAQLQFNYGTDDLANSLLTDTQKAWASTKVAALSNYLVKGTNYLGTRLVLESRIQLQVAFAGLADGMYAVYSYTDGDGVAQNVRVESSEFISVGGVKGLELDQLVYADARAVVTIIVYNANGSVHAVAIDSIEGYVQRNAKSDTDVSMELMKFADSAKAYLYG